MRRHLPYDGSHWDTQKLRRAREFGWFRQHEAELMETARRRHEMADHTRRSVEVDELLRKARGRPCPRCGAEMTQREVEGVEVLGCPACSGFFLERDDLEHVLLAHDAHRRGFLRRLLGHREH
jgi:Transcription factor zinc-finger